MKMTKGNISAIAVHGIVALGYIVMFLLIPFPKYAASWISFGFTLAAIAISLVIAFYANRGDGSITSKVYGFPVLRVGYLYLAVQFVVGAVICLIAALIEVPFWIPLLLSLLLLAAAGVGVIATDNVRDHVQAMDRETERVTKAVKTFRLDMASVLDRCSDSVVKRELEKLAEAIRYSDPVSSEATESIERELGMAIEDLKVDVRRKSQEELLEQIQEVKSLLTERNRICKANK